MCTTIVPHCCKSLTKQLMLSDLPTLNAAELKKDCLDVLYANLKQHTFDTPALGAGYKPFLPVFPKGLVG